MCTKMPYLNENGTMVNDKTTKSNSSASDAENDVDDNIFENKHAERTSTEHHNDDDHNNDDDETTCSSTSSLTSVDSPMRKRKPFDPDVVIATALNYLSTSEPARDELWQFMSYLHTVLKNLPSHLQLELKNKIQQAMKEVEKQDLNGLKCSEAEKDVPDQ